MRLASASSRARMMIRPKAARVSPGAVAGPARPGNLPALTAELVGRATEISSIAELVAARRLVEVLGAAARRFSQPHEALLVALRPRQARAGEAEHGGSEPTGRTRSTEERIAPRPDVAHHAALAHALPADLELGLDQSQAVIARGRAGQDGGQHLVQRDERHIDDHQVRRVRKLLPAQGAGVLALEHAHTGVRAQAPVQLAIADVDGNDVLGPALEQQVGEAARARADIARPPPGHGALQHGQGVCELHRAARDIRRWCVDLELDVLCHELSRLLRAVAPREQHHLTGQHRSGGARARGVVAPITEQTVEPDAFHRR